MWSPQCAFLCVYGCTKRHIRISLNSRGQLKDLVMSQVVLRSRRIDSEDVSAGKSNPKAFLMMAAWSFIPCLPSEGKVFFVSTKKHFHSKYLIVTEN